jgi:chromosome segregation and condensation protein ScpB
LKKTPESWALAGRIATQLMFVNPVPISLTNLRNKLQELGQLHGSPAYREMARLNLNEVVEALLAHNKKLEETGLSIQIREGEAVLSTARVNDNKAAKLIDNYRPKTNAGIAGEVRETLLEVVAFIAYTQPTDYAQLERHFARDMRYYVDMLRGKGWVDSRLIGGRAMLHVTGEFLDAFQASSVDKLIQTIDAAIESKGNQEKTFQSY